MGNSIALLRGVNVGGKGKLSMPELRTALAAEGFEDVRTYINSGNVIFKTAKGNAAPRIEKLIKERFGLEVGVVCLTGARWAAIVAAAPPWWGNDDEFKHNLLVMLEPYDMREVVAQIGELKPDIERSETGEGVLYQSLSLRSFGKTVGGKLATKPVYKRMTVRNYNTAIKLGELLRD